jgi:hypothetical protein
MGYKILLIATKGSKKEADFARLGVNTTSEFSEWADHGVASALIKSGYRLFYIIDKIDPESDIFERLSIGCELLALYIYENMLVSYITFWSNECLQWSILHNCQESVDHLQIEGSPPEIIEKLKVEKNEAKLIENDVDHYFDIPGEIFSSLTGYTYKFRYVFEDIKPWEVLKRKE